MSVAERSQHLAIRISAASWHGTTPPEVAAAVTASSTAPNSGSLTPSWGSAATLWITTFGIADPALKFPVTGWPTNYTDNNLSNGTGDNSTAGIALATRNIAAATEDPGAFTTTAADWWAASTIAVRPSCTPAPTVTSVAPNSGPDTGGTSVTITGTNFVSGATVTFGGTAATGVTFVNATTITATTPVHAAGAVDVVVTNPDTQSGTLTNGYTYTLSATTLEVRVGASSDDAEEWITGASIGAVVLNSGDLEMIHDTGPSDDQEVGMRFQNMTIPKNATITNAYIEFTAEASDAAAINLTFHAEDIDNAPTFTTGTNNITARTETTAAVVWTVPAWTSTNTHQTVDLSSIIQEVVNRDGWASGNSLVILVTGSTSERRSATSYDGNAANAPLLHVEYASGPIAHWTFDEGSGQTAADSSGNSRDGTLGSTTGADANDPTWACVTGGNALDFDGTNDYVEDADGELYINGVTALTLALWVKSDVTGTDKGVFISEDPSSGSDNILALRYDAAGGNGGGTNVIKASVNVSGTSGNYESAQNVQTTSWQHLTLTWSSGNQLALYIDGNLDTPTFNSSARTGTLSNATKLLIGKGTKDASAGWDGQIDDVRLYDRVLSQAEITALAASAPTACAAAPTVTSVAPTSGPQQRRHQRHLRRDGRHRRHLRQRNYHHRHHPGPRRRRRRCRGHQPRHPERHPDEWLHVHGTDHPLDI
jgi:hypothetical protein